MELLLVEITELGLQFSQLSTVVSSTLLGLVSPVLLRDNIDIADVVDMRRDPLPSLESTDYELF